MTRSSALDAAELVRDAGGRVVGKTRLQKLAYLLEVMHLGSGFRFEYRHYGPYSEELATAVHTATLVGLITEEERSANWGGTYSIFTALCGSAEQSSADKEVRKQLVALATEADPIALELAATAAYLALEGKASPWEETERRKPEKAAKCLDKAKTLYAKVRSMNVTYPLPEIS